MKKKVKSKFREMAKNVESSEKFIDKHLNYINQVECADYPSDPVVPLPHKFEDERGVIQNLLFIEKGIKSVAVITSAAGTERSNHYHLTDYHFLYVIEGEMHYYERQLDVDFTNKHIVVRAGQMVFTPPMVVHKTVFTKDTVMLSMAKNVRSYKKHEADMIPEKF